MQDIFSRLDALCAKMTEDAFLHNKGLSNEVGFFVFSYHPDEEMTVRHFFAGSSGKSRDGSSALPDPPL